LVDVIFSRFGVPLQLLSDNGKEFDNLILREICRLLEIDKIRTTTYKASTNGAVERVHRTMNAMLGKVVETNQRDWDTHLPSVMGAYRASRHESTGYSPNFLMLGRENYAPLDIIMGVPVEEATQAASCEDFVEEKIQTMRKAYALARENLGCRAERAKRGYDMRVRPNKYPLGTWVYYYSPRRYMGRSPKWQRMYSGPFLVVGVLGPVNVRIQASRRSKPFIVHIDKLKLCLGPTPESWVKEEAGETVQRELVDLPVDEQFLESLQEHEGEDEQMVDDRLMQPDDIQQTTVEELAAVAPRPARERRRPGHLRDFV